MVLWDTEELYQVEIENFKKETADLVISERFPGYWKMVESTHPFERKDAFTIEYKLTLPAESTGAKKTVLTFNLNRINVQGNEPQSY